MKNQNSIETETWLPVFPGFYSSIFDSEGAEEYQITNASDLENIEYDAIEWDYEEYQERVAKAVTNEVCKQLIDLGFISSGKYDGVYSPPFFNYTNDSINVTFEISAQNKANISRYLCDNPQAWGNYLKDNFTSVPGFVSFHSNDAIHNDWKLDNALTEQTRCGSILDFILLNEGFTTADLYYSDEVSNQINTIDYKIKTPA